MRCAASPPDVAEFVHYATSQDILDTAMMLVAHRALGPLLDDLTGTAEVSATLAATGAPRWPDGRCCSTRCR
jgi:3-carboxy-cis,cis-muconate cycloisomerase